MALLYRRLDKSEVTQRAIDAFTGIYLMHVSIIQGLAFGVLAAKGVELIEKQPLDSVLAHLPRALFSLGAVAIVSYQYAVFISVYRRSLTVFDFLLPLFLGLSELAPAYFLAQPLGWWLSTGLFLLMSALGFLNTWFTSPLRAFGAAIAHRRTSRVLLAFIAVCLAGILVCAFAAIAAWRGSLTLRVDIGAVSALVVLATAMLIAGERYINQLRRDFGA